MASSSNWFQTIQMGDGNSDIHIFGFPYAGGSVSSFRPLQQVIDDRVSCHVASLPGRGSRFSEPATSNIRTIVGAMVDGIGKINPGKYALFGHSMGGILGFEVARELRRRAIRMPEVMVASGVAAPHLFGRDASEHRYNLPREEFIEYLNSLDGTPTHLLENPALMEMVLPTLRRDFELCDTYVYQSEAPLDVPIVTFHGSDDDGVGSERAQEWSSHTRGDSQFVEFSGGHFFINDHWPAIGKMLNSMLV